MNRATRLFCCDLNWTRYSDTYSPASLPQDWAFIDPKEYVDWHLEFGNNTMFCQAYTFCGYAFYPSKLGPVAPGPGCELLPRLMEEAKNAGVPFWSYFSVSWDLITRGLRGEWTFPHQPAAWCLGPETVWTDLLCARVREFLADYPVDWILFDMFLYGEVDNNGFPLVPAPPMVYVQFAVLVPSVLLVTRPPKSYPYVSVTLPLTTCVIWPARS